MEYKIYLDYTIELLSQIKIPSYIIDTPYIWDNQIDGGLRNNIFTQNANMNNQENFSQFISSFMVAPSLYRWKASTTKGAFSGSI